MCGTSNKMNILFANDNNIEKNKYGSGIKFKKQQKLILSGKEYVSEHREFYQKLTT